MKQTYILLLFFSFTLVSQAQHKSPYKIFTARGAKTSYGKMLKQLEKTDVVLFGELHNNPICHWLSLSLIEDIHKGKEVQVATEVFEAKTQPVIDAYLEDKLTIEGLESSISLWENYKTDYKPLLNYAQKHQIPFIATNTAKDISSLVFHEGFDPILDLVEEEKMYLPRLPIPFDESLPQYQKILTMSGDHGTLNTIKAQALKDATMAHFIDQNSRSGNLIFHINGSYHSEYKEGINWYLNRYNPYIAVSYTHLTLPTNA